ncbi:MAG: hypothetical protein EOO73_20355 [Myxococcales bacterium]|nr:MAG: hypothetical protein EOO73_20355 [Myxococcales bacterium]
MKPSRVVIALVVSWSIVGCGDYSAEPKGAGGTPSSTGGTGVIPPGGSAASGSPVAGGGGSGGGAAGGTAGTGGMVGTGGRETPPEAACESVTACGGNVPGVWFATSSCLPVTGLAQIGELGIGCSEVATSGKLEVTGNLTIGADGMFSDNTSTTGEVALELPAECLDVSGTVTTCDKISSPLGSAGFDSVECVDSTTTTGGCTCTGKIKQTGSMAWLLFDPAKTGTYEAMNNSLKLASSIKTVEYAYCVEGNFMKVTPTTKTIIGDVKGTVVLQKQP